jgi:hypothetical protein
MSKAIHGSCLCGAVTFVVEPPLRRMIHCHCSRCRKGTGTGHATNLYVEPSQVSWATGEPLISRFELASAKSFGKWFCRQCGSPLPRPTRSGKVMVIPAGSLDTALPVGPSDHIFWGSRAPWGCEAGSLPTHVEYPSWW